MTFKSLRLIAVSAFAVLLVGTVPANAQIVVNANDDVNFKLGVLGQFQADTIDNADADSSNLFVRRLRLIFGGQVAKNVTFFVETDSPNLGRTLPGGKNIQPSVILQDAYASLKVADALTLDAGLMFVPFSRNSLQSAATLLPIDYGVNTFNASAPTQSATGRDTGFQARGYLYDNHIEYRIGVFQGMRDAGSDNAFRYAGRLQFNVLDPETGFFYAGTYLGMKKVLAVAAAFDAQKDFQACDVDAFFNSPIGPGAVTLQFDYNRFDGGNTLKTLARQNDVLVEGGYLFRAVKLMPLLQFVHRDVTSASAGEETRTSIGANYWWAGHNANIKALYTRIEPRGLRKQNEFTVQLQIFYF
jgi:Phosphate-selective porin O and P